MKRNVSAIGVLIAVLATVSLPSQAAENFLKIGHRGARALADENTLESLQMAVEMGVDYLEFDVQRTRDGVFVLMHDDTVDRTTDGVGRVDEMDLADFEKLRTGRGCAPPTLDAALTWLATNDVGFILDFKITDPDQARELIALVESHRMLDRAVFESPDPAVAGLIDEIRPELITAVYPTNMLAMRWYCNKYSIDIASYQYYFANPLEVWLEHKSGRQVVVWTVNSPGLIKWFKKIGVDGVMTDDPNNFK